MATESVHARRERATHQSLFREVNERIEDAMSSSSARFLLAVARLGRGLALDCVAPRRGARLSGLFGAGRSAGEQRR